MVKQATGVDERALGMSATTVASRLTVLIVPLAVAPLVAPATVGAAFFLAAAMSVPVVLAMRAVAQHIDDPGPRQAASVGSIQ
jgi:hypothetical protein